jgi:hypothetical protein
MQEEKREILGAVTALRAEQPEAVPEPLVAALRYGLAAHHAGCLPAWKSLIERCFQSGEAICSSIGSGLTVSFQPCWAAVGAPTSNKHLGIARLM